MSGGSLAEMFVRLRPDGKTFQPEADRIVRRTKLDRAGNQVGLGLSKSIGGGMRVGLGGAFKSAFGPIAAAAGAIGIGKFLQGAVSQASDLGETMSKSAAVFGSSNSIIEKFAATSAKSLGQTKQQAVGAAAQFGNMFNQLGIGQKQAAGMSTQMVSLASDFASFHNADITEVLEAQQAAFRGEFDSIQKFVPTINAAAVEQEGMRLKLAGSTKELTAQDKALATQSLMMKGAGKAQGDFARTSGGLANQQRILSAQFSDFKTSIGQFALPLVTKFFTFLNDQAMPVLGEIKGGITAFGAAWKYNDGEITSSGFPGFMERVGFVARQAFGYFQSDVMPVLRQLSVWVKNEVVPALVRFGGYLGEVVIPVVRRLVVEGLKGFKAGIDNVRTAFEQNKPQLETFISKIGDIVKWVSEKLGPVLGWLAGRQMKFVYGQIALVITAIGKFVTAISSVVTWVKSAGSTIAGVWAGVKSTSQSALRFVVDRFLGFVGAMISGAAKAFGWVPGIGPKLRTAAAEFQKFRTSVNNSLAGINDQVIRITPVVLSATGSKAAKAQAAESKKYGFTFARGGAVFGQGTATSDSIPAMLSNGEHVWTAKEVQKAGGHSAVEQMRQSVLKYAKGGRVDIETRFPSLARPVANIAAAATAVARPVAQALVNVISSASSPGLAKVLSFVKSQVGKPYLWGGVGPGGYDCSGLVSAAINTAFGRNPYRRLGATGSMPWSMFASGPGAFEVGWFKGNPGHTAATVNGVNIESSGGRGVHMGPGARGARNGLFTNRMHVKGFAGGGRVDGRDGDMPFDLLKNRRDLREELGLQVFDQGGPWRSGTLGVNLSGKTETVVPGGGAVELGPDTIRALVKGWTTALTEGKFRIVGSSGGSYVLQMSNG